MIEPVPRQEVFDAYWKFAAERQAIFERRLAGQPAPWTADPILQEHKFCCTFRAADRVSQYMIRQLYADPAASKADLVFRAVALRIFSKPSTWAELTAWLGHQPSIADLEGETMERCLNALKAAKRPIYTAAFILPSGSGAYENPVKHYSHLKLLHDMFIRKSLGDRIVGAGSLESVYELLHGFDMMGDFLAYQAAIDINYTTAVNFSENDFVQAGPGAVRGIAKVFQHTMGWGPSRIIQWMVEHQQDHFDRLGLEWNGLFGRQLHGIDAQGLFCETDKYSRAAFPELASNRVKIKAKFKPDPEPLPPLFFPPKWGINDKLPAQPKAVSANLGGAP